MADTEALSHLSNLVVVTACRLCIILYIVLRPGTRLVLVIMTFERMYLIGYFNLGDILEHDFPLFQPEVVA
jgi:hypothetical protein